MSSDFEAVKHSALADMEASSPPPAGMPSADAIADEIQRYIPTFHGANEAARAVLALFAPILAEKERAERELAEERDTGAISLACWQEAARTSEARALAAEAALASGRANAVDGSIDIRLDDKGGVDEIFGNGVLCHIERMNKGEWFVILTRPDQSQEAFWLTGKGKVEFTMHEHRQAPTTGPNVEPWAIAAAIRAQGE